jgi:hypothetical protein
MQPVSSINEAIYISTKWNTERYNAIQQWKQEFYSLDQSLPISPPTIFHQFIWTSETTYRYIPPIEPGAFPIFLSVITIPLVETGLSHHFIQVMLQQY